MCSHKRLLIEADGRILFSSMKTDIRFLKMENKATLLSHFCEFVKYSYLSEDDVIYVKM